MTTWSTPAPDLVSLYKQMYADQIAVSYENKGVLKNFVTMENGADGISKEFPLIGVQSAYERVGGELIQPNQPITANAKMVFQNFEASSNLPLVEQSKIKNPSYIPTLVNRQVDAIVSKQEQQLINALVEPATIKASDQSVTNIIKALQVLGDGTSRAGASLVVGDLKPFSFDCLISIKTLFDNMGVADGDRYVYLPIGAIKILLKDPLFTNTQYVPNGTAPLQNSGTMYSELGLTICTAQMNPNGGLPVATISATNYVTAFAFTRDAVINETNSATPMSNMWLSEEHYSYMFRANMRTGSAVVAPSKTIQIVTTSI